MFEIARTSQLCGLKMSATLSARTINCVVYCTFRFLMIPRNADIIGDSKNVNSIRLCLMR